MSGMMSMFANPMLMMGLGMLGQSGRSRNPTNPAAGAMQGLQMGQQAQTQQQQMLYMQQLMQAKKAEEERKRQQQQMMPQLMGAYMNPDPDMATETRGQALAGMMGADPSLAKAILPSMMKPKLGTAMMQNLAAAGLQAGTPEYEKQMLAALTSPRVSVNVGTQAEKEAGLAMALLTQAEADVEKYESISPTAAGVAGTLPGRLISSDDAVRLAAAQDRWTAQMVKLISGAAASDRERTAIKNAYFAPIGASPEVKADYARARQEAMKAGVIRSGPAWDNFKEILESKEGGGLPTPQTDAEFDALDSGAQYIDPADGKPYTKP